MINISSKKAIKTNIITIRKIRIIKNLPWFLIFTPFWLDLPSSFLMILDPQSIGSAIDEITESESLNANDADKLSTLER